MRRESLIEAGLEVFGTIGYANSTVSDICEHARLNRRYFYESFNSREELLLAVFEKIVEEAAAATTAAILAVEGLQERVEAGIATWFAALASDPRRARVVAVETVAVSPRVDERALAARDALAEFLVEQLTQLAGGRQPLGGVQPAVAVRWAMAGNVDLIMDWLRGDSPMSAAEVTEQATRVILLFFSAAYPGLVEPLA